MDENTQKNPKQSNSRCDCRFAYIKNGIIPCTLIQPYRLEPNTMIIQPNNETIYPSNEVEN